MDVSVPAGLVRLAATLSTVGNPAGVVLFAHGSGSSRHSPRNQAVARRLNAAGFHTLLLDLLTETEEETDARTAQWRFDIGLLSQRLVAACDWAQEAPSLNGAPIGLFGASTGAAAALQAAAQRPGIVRAVVSRGGRPDLAGPVIAAVTAPTLLIVGGQDHAVIELNELAQAALGQSARLLVIPGATHLFTEPGALERVADEAAAWFGRWLIPEAPEMV